MDKFANIIKDYSSFIADGEAGLDGQTVYDENILPCKKSEIILAVENLLVFTENKLPLVTLY